MHVTVPLAGAVHTVQLLPQELGSVLLFATQELAQAWNPALQVTPQMFPLQIGFPLAGSMQAVHPVGVQPAATLLFTTHVVAAPVPQACEPALHVTPHVAPLQTATLLAGAVQATHPVALHPDATLLLATQVLPHR